MAAISESAAFLDFPRNAVAFGTSDERAAPYSVHQANGRSTGFCHFNLVLKIFRGFALGAGRLAHQIAQERRHRRQGRDVVDCSLLQRRCRHFGESCVFRILHHRRSSAGAQDMQAGTSVGHRTGHQNADRTMGAASGYRTEQGIDRRA